MLPHFSPQPAPSPPRGGGVLSLVSDGLFLRNNVLVGGGVPALILGTYYGTHFFFGGGVRFLGSLGVSVDAACCGEYVWFSWVLLTLSAIIVFGFLTMREGVFPCCCCRCSFQGVQLLLFGEC